MALLGAGGPITVVDLGARRPQVDKRLGACLFADFAKISYGGGGGPGDLGRASLQEGSQESGGEGGREVPERFRKRLS